ncbi:MAG: hypothetical protein IJU76_08435 [Desulfovibrionaceae bacterium]|nr:hypothetical protein [Desulfovibrionaceae bacterium]
MATKRGILCVADSVRFADIGSECEKLSKKACFLPNAQSAGLYEIAQQLGGVPGDAAALTGDGAFVLVKGAENLAPALEACNRRTLLVVVLADGVAFYGLAIDSKKGKVDRAATAQDLALTIATILDLPITGDCTAAILYQVLKDPNLKLNELIKLQEALSRMESVIERNNREPWDKHDCA